MKAKSVTIKTKKVMVMYGGRMRSSDAITYLKNQAREHAHNHRVSAVVPTKIKALLQKEADTQGLNLSALIGTALVMYLQDCGTKIEA